MEKTKDSKKDNNIKLFPLYRALSLDFLFFYTINFLFLTQVKNFAPADVVLEESFYSLFSVIFQFPATFIVDKLGRKKGMVLRKYF